MKLTPENRKALEEAFAVNDAPVFGKGTVRAAYAEKHSKSYEQCFEDAAALLLEIWEPLAEMVEARGKATEGPWLRANYLVYNPNGEAELGNFTVCEGFWEENTHFIQVAGNNLAAIRKAVGHESNPHV